METESHIGGDLNSLTKQDLIDIYEQVSPGLYRYAIRLLGDVYLAEDCVSATFIRFLDALQRGGGPSDNVRAYLYRIAHNWITDDYRRRRPEVELEVGNSVSGSDSPARAVGQELDRQQVREALLSLPEDQRQVIMLRFYEAWSHEETAAALGRSVEATRALQYRALKGLRRRLLPAREPEVMP